MLKLSGTGWSLIHADLLDETGELIATRDVTDSHPDD